MEDTILNLGVGGIFAIMIIDRVMAFVKSWKGEEPHDKDVELYREACTSHLKAIKAQVRDLHTWHAPNQDGEQSWKNTRMIGLLEKLDETIKHNTEVIVGLNRANEKK